MSNIIFSKDKKLEENEINDLLKKINFECYYQKNSKQKIVFAGCKNIFQDFENKNNIFDGYENIYSLQEKKDFEILNYDSPPTKKGFVVLDCGHFYEKSPLEKELQCLISNGDEISVLSFYFQIHIFQAKSFKKFFFNYENVNYLNFDKVYPEYFEFEKCKNIKNYFNITNCIKKYKNKEPLSVREIYFIKMIENNICEDFQFLIFKYRDYFKSLLDK